MPSNSAPKAVIVTVLVLTFAGLCLAFVLFLPWAELGMPVGDKIPPVMGALSNLYDTAHSRVPELVSGALRDEKFKNVSQYYVYSFFLAASLIAAAIALNCAGRDESEEKTVLPMRKQ